MKCHGGPLFHSFSFWAWSSTNSAYSCSLKPVSIPIKFNGTTLTLEAHQIHLQLRILPKDLLLLLLFYFPWGLPFTWRTVRKNFHSFGEHKLARGFIGNFPGMSAVWCRSAGGDFKLPLCKATSDSSRTGLPICSWCVATCFIDSGVNHRLNSANRQPLPSVSLGQKKKGGVGIN